ncbi:hypothetical protein CLOAM0724 [Candidatus Cloacimonas acidaminovorans str. Evry]|uniref:Uncharacterized protein n=1 Tax=Cloacimonas acidaminovorans (strain Evry) TaxID=459349 RepID=B0VGZ2_CLOAI|nr:hypothetical protein CLOAM0724 [Candidatus Cloacimonas acidaminovorans str. Evry]
MMKILNNNKAKCKHLYFAYESFNQSNFPILMIIQYVNCKNEKGKK